MSTYITLHRNSDGYLAGSIVEAGSQEEAVRVKQSTLAPGLKVLAVSDAVTPSSSWPQSKFFVEIQVEAAPRLVPTNKKVRAI